MIIFFVRKLHTNQYFYQGNHKCLKRAFHSTTKNINDCPYEKDYLVCNLPNKSKLHIVQLHVAQKYMDVAYEISIEESFGLPCDEFKFCTNLQWVSSPKNANKRNPFFGIIVNQNWEIFFYMVHPFTFIVS